MKPLSLLLCLALLTPVWGQELPDTPQCSSCTVPDSMVRDKQILFAGSPKALPHHNWLYRHPIWTATIISVPVALIIAKKTNQSCPSMVTGYPYNGYGHPCPTRCDSDGCYWPKK